MLDFRIETFLCVCKYMNYTKAAEELNITQPGVSQHIHYLEEYYQTKLFQYSNKKLSLTSSGEKLKTSMLSMKHDSIHLKETMSSLESSKKFLKFGATLTIGEFVIPPKLADYMKKNPQVQVEFIIANTQKLLDLLDEGLIEFAVIEGYFSKSEYEFRLVSNEDYIGVCGSAYPIDHITDLSQLFSHNMLLRENGSGTKEILEHYLVEQGYSFTNFEHISQINNLHTIKQLLMQNCGISFMYKIAAQKQLTEGTLKEICISDFHVTHEFNFVWRKNSIYKEHYKQIFYSLFA
ncbi:LysR family transcriptional regulator [Anaeromicropila populeti]|uniref:DNA-binding transcriptional regulator, LysR family n=1 Tax=Anaeromicropila populeti TaxID=37658 RepID=A0A1I6HYG9_9FIRM|nr:LysR family transcriptional regulator [Anaeromicropila populeti]SFR59516.1 DNA-binding transcriptional regulator, LysR family [Anaeromicropila populeti]